MLCDGADQAVGPLYEALLALQLRQLAPLLLLELLFLLPHGPVGVLLRLLDRLRRLDRIRLLRGLSRRRASGRGAGRLPNECCVM